MCILGQVVLVKVLIQIEDLAVVTLDQVKEYVLLPLTIADLLIVLVVLVVHMFRRTLVILENRIIVLLAAVLEVIALQAVIREVVVDLLMVDQCVEVVDDRFKFFSLNI